jgi:hypothetical protein
VIADIRQLGFLCAEGEHTTPEAATAYHAVVCIFDAMHAMAPTGIAVKAAGKKLAMVVDEAHQIVHDRR